MGKISDRLTNKSHPLYKPSKELFKDYRRYWAMLDDLNDEDDSYEDSDAAQRAHDCFLGLIKRMEDVLKKSSGPDFIKWMEFMNLHSEGVADSDEILGSFMEDCSNIALIGAGSSKERAGLLVGIPIRMRGKKLAWQLDLPEHKHEGLTEILRKYDFLEEDSVIQYMPRLVSVNEALFLDFRTFYHIRQAFINKNPREAYRLMLEHRMLSGAGLPDLHPPSSPESHTMGVLIAYVESEDLHEVLPVDNQLNRANERSDDGDESSYFDKAEYSALLLDVDSVCEKMSVDLSKLFEGVSLSPTQQLQPIYSARIEAAQNERRFYWMSQLAEYGWSAKDTKHLSIVNNFEVVKNENDLTVIVRDLRVPAKEFRLIWKKIIGESLKSALQALIRTAVILEIALEPAPMEA